MTSNDGQEQALALEAAGKNRKDLQAYLKKTIWKPQVQMMCFETSICRPDVWSVGWLRRRKFYFQRINPPKKTRKKLSSVEKELKQDAETGWQYSNAKAALKAAIMENDVPLCPSPDEDEEDLENYFSCRPEIQNYGDFRLFKGRLNALRDQIRNDMTRAE